MNPVDKLLALCARRIELTEEIDRAKERIHRIEAEILAMIEPKKAPSRREIVLAALGYESTIDNRTTLSTMELSLVLYGNRSSANTNTTRVLLEAMRADKLVTLHRSGSWMLTREAILRAALGSAGVQTSVSDQTSVDRELDSDAQAPKNT